MEDQKPTNKSIMEGTIAQAAGGAIGVLAVTTMASFGHYMQAGWESAFGTIVSIGLYLGFKKFRQ